MKKYIKKIIISLLIIVNISCSSSGIKSIFVSDKFDTSSSYNEKELKYIYNSDIERNNNNVRGTESNDSNNIVFGRNFSFIASGTVEGIASLTKNILTYMDSDIVDYTIIYDGDDNTYSGYRYYYKEGGKCSGSCQEFVVVIKKNKNILSGRAETIRDKINNYVYNDISSLVNVMAVTSNSDSRMKQYYFEMSKYVKTTSIFSYNKNKTREYNNNENTAIYNDFFIETSEIQFRSNALPGDIASWSLEIIEQMGYLNPKISKIGTGTYVINFGKSMCYEIYNKNKKDNKKNDDIKDSFYRFQKRNIDYNNCYDFTIDITSRGKQSIVNFSSIVKSPVAMEFYDKISNIIHAELY